MEFELVKKFIKECDEKVELIKNFVEECNEKVKLFNELIQIDGEEWREMVAELTKKEFEDEQRRMQRRIIEMEREEQDEWDKHLEEVAKRLQLIKFFEELPSE